MRRSEDRKVAIRQGLCRSTAGGENFLWCQSSSWSSQASPTNRLAACNHTPASNTYGLKQRYFARAAESSSQLLKPAVQRIHLFHVRQELANDRPRVVYDLASRLIARASAGSRAVRASSSSCVRAAAICACLAAAHRASAAFSSPCSRRTSACPSAGGRSVRPLRASPGWLGRSLCLHQFRRYA